MRFLAALAAALAWCGAALADPVGTFDVVGINPDTGGKYTGVVEVRRSGETYKIAWSIAGDRYVGTGLGARIHDGRITVGAASGSDVGLSVGYISGNSFGMAMYFEKKDDRWEGVWTYAGSNRVAKEIWVRR